MRTIGWIMAVAAAAALAGCTSDAVDGRADQPTLRVTCAATTPGATTGADVRELRRRASALGDPDATVRADGATVVTTLRASRQAVRTLCESGTLEFRGLVAPPVRISCSGTNCNARPADVLGSATLPAPTTSYSRNGLPLDAAAALGKRLPQLDCAAAARSAAALRSYRVVCTAEGTAPALGYVLGPAVLPAGGIESARATAPSGGVPSWTITVRLTLAGRQAWSAFTAAHNAGQTNVGDAAACTTNTVPCPTYVAFVYNGRVLSAPVTQERIAGAATQISGGFTKASATALARSLASGSLGVPLRLVSVRPG